MVFRLDDVTVTLGGKIILDHLHLSFAPGLNYLIGRNGSGKSTLLNCMARLGSYQGKIFLNDSNIRSTPHKQYAQLVAVVPQQPTIQFRIRVWDFVLLGRYPYLNWLGSYRPEDFAQAETSLQKLNLIKFKERFLDQLSGGEFQLVCLARALCQDTAVLLLDEPGQMLDPLHRIALYDHLENLAQMGKTLICTTHDFEALTHAEATVSGLKQGKVIYQQPGGASRDQIMKEVFY